jgi:pimeloyl-ACP methyl ester carboxylesterase
MPVSDREFFRQPSNREFFLATFREGFRNGPQGHIHENLLLFTRPWGFALEAIKAEVHLWHGESDTTVPVENAHYLSEHIPNCKLHLLPGVGHLVPEIWDDIFRIFVA